MICFYAEYNYKVKLSYTDFPQKIYTGSSLLTATGTSQNIGSSSISCTLPVCFKSGQVLVDGMCYGVGGDPGATLRAADVADNPPARFHLILSPSINKA